MSTVKKRIYNFGNGYADGDASMKEILGGKGANLAEMCNQGLPVPPGFTISTELCNYYYANNNKLPAELTAEVNTAIKKIEEALDRKFGDTQNPLLVSVRSGSKESMPGMMDTVLNLGLNDQTVEGLAKKHNNYRFAFDSYRRFIQMYSDVVLGIDHYLFEELIDLKKQERDITQDIDLTVEDLKDLVAQFKNIVKQETGNEFPQDANHQLWGAINAVFGSWMCPRAMTYRKLNDIPESWGTAVNIQSMVFGNIDHNSATGVAFTRNPSTGEKMLYGEYLINAQGEDVVAGIRTPQSITKNNKNSDSDLPSMEESMPKIYQEFVSIIHKLEQHYRDMQDIEFTVQEGKLWILQTRSGKRTASSALKIAVDLVQEGLISKEEAISRIKPESLDQLLHPTIDASVKYQVLCKGLPASPGAASGIIVFSADEAERRKAIGDKVILVRMETSPEDIHGMYAAEGILTSRGGMTSHAAVVARGMGRPCICGASNVSVDYQAKHIKIADKIIKEGEMITINGGTGEVIMGAIKTIQPNISGNFKQIMQWADEIKSLQIRTNAETVTDVKTALNFGAEGIGLCRTEHMFFEADRIISVRKMILSDNVKDREAALAEILPMQKQDFIKIFNLMESRPINIRLLDPPLHEFLPHTEEEMLQFADQTNLDYAFVKTRCKQLAESNPMLGHRGCRLGITFPEIYRMQSKAIFEAMVEVQKLNQGRFNLNIEIMIPLIATSKELEIMRNLVVNAAKEVEHEFHARLEYKIGTMIELPRAALRAGEIAEFADFMSYGTNDLSQTTFGISRDDAGSFIPSYKEQMIFEHDPFVRLDEEGVGELIKISVERARRTKSNIKIGVCGEHGGNPESVMFFHKAGLNYVSCSPYRVPIARLSAAQAKLKFN
jgi:pyruvate,orthophosphate dikinase